MAPTTRAPSMKKCGQASRPISTGKLNALLHLHRRPINLVVSEGSSATEVEGYLIFGRASRLDAFSAYPFQAQLPSDAPGGTTGTLEARGFRSSRTRKPSRQVSCAHGTGRGLDADRANLFAATRDLPTLVVRLKRSRKKRPALGRAYRRMIPATSYSPTQSPTQYHRRREA